MSAAKIYSDRYDSNNEPDNFTAGPAGAWFDTGTVTVPTTSLDEENDTVNFFGVLSGRTLYGAFIEAGDVDSGSAADIDLVLIDPDAAITAAPNETLWNSGTAFQGAVSKFILFATPVKVPRTDKGYCNVALVVNTAAGTPAQQSVSVMIFGL